MTNTVNTNTTPTTELQFVPITDDMITANKERFIQLLNSTGRKGVSKLITYLEKNGFFEAPASAADNLACKGGLVQHSLKMADHTLDENKIMPLKCESMKVLFVSLVQDVGLVGQYGKPALVENILAGGKQSDSKPYNTNSDLLPMNHGARSAQIVGQFVQLEEDEAFAITYHHGLTGDACKAKNNGSKEVLLQYLVNNADNKCAQFLERRNTVLAV